MSIDRDKYARAAVEAALTDGESIVSESSEIAGAITFIIATPQMTQERGAERAEEINAALVAAGFDVFVRPGSPDSFVGDPAVRALVVHVDVGGIRGGLDGL